MVKKAYINSLVGMAFVFAGFRGILNGYIDNTMIIDKGVVISGLVFAVFLGVHLLGTGKTEREFRRDLFCKNMIALVFFYYVVADFIRLYWSKILFWRMSNPVTDLSLYFLAIPFNDLSLEAAVTPDILLKIIRIIYCSGYITPLFLPAIANSLQGHYKQAWTYILSGHLLQVFIITPIYLLFPISEIWYVTGQMDPLARVFSDDFDRAFTVAWCFPSMHTSVAMASLLVAWKEENRLFKWMWCSYCILIIASTFLLPIHWVVDVIGGIILGYGAVVIANKIMLILEEYDYSAVIPKSKRDSRRERAGESYSAVQEEKSRKLS